MHERVKKIRKTLSMTQQEFANRLGITRSNISHIESGERNLSNQTITSICREFNVNEEWLRTGEGEMFIETTPDEIIADTFGRLLNPETDPFVKKTVLAILHVIDKMDDDDWQDLKQYIESLNADK